MLAESVIDTCLGVQEGRSKVCGCAASSAVGIVCGLLSWLAYAPRVAGWFTWEEACMVPKEVVCGSTVPGMRTGCPIVTRAQAVVVCHAFLRVLRERL